MSHEKQSEPIPTMTAERTLALINSIIDRMVNDAGGHTSEVIKSLSELGFTKEELIEVFHFSETDVQAYLDDRDEEVEQ